MAAPEVPHRVAVAAVPFPPQRWEAADVVAVGLADVPGLGDELGPRDDGVLGDEIEEGREAVETALLAGQRRGEIESEAVDAHLQQPVAQRVHHHLQGERVGRVDRVAATGGVEVAPRVRGVEPVEGRVVDPAVTQRRAAVVALGRVVEHHVQHDLQARAVQCVDHRLELGHLPAGPSLAYGG